jgi:DNA repair exonuclease SbcCD ATPase subunit
MMTLEDVRERDAELCAVIEQQQEQLRAVLAHVEELRAKNERLTNAIRRIDGINDYPANYSPLINAICDEILRPHLESKS